MVFGGTCAGKHVEAKDTPAALGLPDMLSFPFYSEHGGKSRAVISNSKYPFQPAPGWLCLYAASPGSSRLAHRNDLVIVLGRVSGQLPSAQVNRHL